MTNEQMAERIQAGDTDLLPELWEKTFKILYLIAGRLYVRYGQRCAEAGITREDLWQESYFVLLGAIKAYSPDSGFALTTYFYLQFLKRLRVISAAARDMVGHCASLDKPLDKNDSGSDTPLDIVADDADTEARVIDNDLHGDIIKALSCLPDAERECLTLHYLEQKSRQDIAAMRKTSSRDINNTIARGLKKLRYGKPMKILSPYAADIIDCYAYNSSFSLWENTGYSSTERAAFKLMGEDY